MRNIIIACSVASSTCLSPLVLIGTHNSLPSLVFSPDCGSQINTHTYRDPWWSGGVEMRQYLRSAWKKENTVCHVQSLTNQHTHTLPISSLAKNLMNSCSHWEVIVLVLNRSVLVFTVPLWLLSSLWSVWKCSYDVSHWNWKQNN